MITDMAPDEIVQVYDKNTKEFISVLRAAVLTEARFSFVPEILDIFEDQSLKFLEIFSGRVIDVPPIKSLVEKMQQVSIWVLMETARKKNVPLESAVAQIATKFRIRKVEVKRVDEAMSELMSHMSLEFRPDNGEEEDN